MMNYSQFSDHGSWLFGAPLALGLGFLMMGLIVWSLIWKGLSLWKSARLGHKGWFIALLLINTAGILDILYIYVFSKRNTIQKMMASAEPVKEEAKKEEHHHQS